MNNQRRSTNPASMLIRSMDGARIPGGCDHCNAYQTIGADHWGPDMHRITTHHDDWCPFLRRMEARR